LRKLIVLLSLLIALAPTAPAEIKAVNIELRYRGINLDKVSTFAFESVFLDNFPTTAFVVDPKSVKYPFLVL
jgi:hypothetical protein